MKTQLKTIKTNKLFYKAWPYKIVCKLETPYRVRNIFKPSFYKMFTTNKPNKRDYIDELKFFNIIQNIPKSDYKLRFEYRSISVFCKDHAIYNSLKNELAYCIREVHEPRNETELEYMIEHGQKRRIVDKFPHGKYLYRIYIKPSMPLNQRENFNSWLEKYSDSFAPSRATKLWLIGTHFYNQAPFVYVENEGMLAFAGMFLGDNIKLTEKFVLRSSINNEDITEENSCQHLVKD